jgi:prepilin-type N-terminal cleavage/methylation domain-containing protein
VKKLLRKLKNKKGFTLIELIVVIAVLGILAAIIIPTISGFTDKANAKAVTADARIIITGAAAAYAENNDTPTEDEIAAITGIDAASFAYTGTDSVITFTYTKGDWSVSVIDSVIGIPSKA